MITPSFGLTATERVLPKLALDFTTATLDSRVTFTRSGNTATYTNSSGVITAINADLPRFDYNPTTLICQGLLIEEARTNIVLNSLINGTNLSTQIVTTSATAYTLSFYGTGSIVLTGTHSATVTGTGVYPSRKTYTFTPTAGALTLTVSGTVQYAQLEAGSFATSFIPTSVASVTRNADVATMTGTNFSSWYNASEGTFECEVMRPNLVTAGVFPRLFNVSDASGTYTINNMEVFLEGSNYIRSRVRVADVNQAIGSGTTPYVANTIRKASLSYKLNNFAAADYGLLSFNDTSGTVPTVSQINFGTDGSVPNFFWNGWIRKFNYWKQHLIDAETTAITKN